MPGLSALTLANMATGASGKPMWPSDLTGLILWLPADQIQGIGSGASLSVWTDSSASGSHATQPSAISQGVYIANIQGGWGGVSFGNGIGQVMNSPTSLHDGSTVGMVASVSTTAGSMRIVGGTVGTSRLAMSSNNWQFLRGNGVGAGVPVVGQFKSFIGFADSLLSNTTVTASGSLFTGSTATSGVTSPVVALGALNPSSSTFSGVLGEVLVYNRNLGENERVSLDSYFRTKWAL